MKLLLLSNSTAPGNGYLAHARDAIADHLRAIDELLFVPYALADHDGYTAKVAAFMEPLGIRVRGVHTGDPRELADRAQAVFIGGGNSFRLLKSLQQHGLLEPIRERVAAGAPYMGSSAGTNMACPTLRTTNDMPIVEPAGFETLGLLPFQINPHYLDPAPESSHMGETREERLTQFLEENDVPVLGMREGTWLRRTGDHLELAGVPAGARLFLPATAPSEHGPGTDLSHLLNTPAHFDTRAAR
ncbi:dipeptidase PepE [Streptomyces purpurogeneiscleroticus]|uniref:dipeptidase PepE n=1 Tax=Streptomyces purpurogeneiscleroticus TaxID=68259 RepID=UPI001CBC91B1|nr:dipeptidase PepE [Streptomyces purpurogeneiscleroticus]MBZ4015230.1 dipeptidase E [Streptomyces purpurogeneiscleroticus]